MPLLKQSKQASIIFTTSVVAYEGNEMLLDYTASKGALTGVHAWAFTAGDF